MYVQNRNRLTDIENRMCTCICNWVTMLYRRKTLYWGNNYKERKKERKPVVTGGGGGRGRIGFGINRCKLLCIKQISNKVFCTV